MTAQDGAVQDGGAVHRGIDASLVDTTRLDALSDVGAISMADARADAMDSRMSSDVALDRGFDAADVSATDSRVFDVRTEDSMRTDTGSTTTDAGTPILCSNACRYANDGECDDGAFDSDTDTCAFGSDCIDCGQRVRGRPDCGDGIENGAEICDDGNRVNGDGCNVFCDLEAGYTDCATYSPGTPPTNWLAIQTGDATSGTAHARWVYGASTAAHYTNEMTCLGGYLDDAEQTRGWVSTHASGCGGVGAMGTVTFRVSFTLTATDTLGTIRAQISADNRITAVRLNGYVRAGVTTDWRESTRFVVPSNQMNVGSNTIEIDVQEDSAAVSGNNTGIAFAIDTSSWYRCQ